MPPDEMTDELEFENQIKGMPDRQLNEFVARQVYGIRQNCVAEASKYTSLETRVSAVESSDKKLLLASGGIGGSITGAIFAAINLFTGH
jgi:hypothetical protein